MRAGRGRLAGTSSRYVRMTWPPADCACADQLGNARCNPERLHRGSGGPKPLIQRACCAEDLWWSIHRPSVAALIESLGISCRAEDAWEAADVLLGSHPGGLVALNAMIGNSVDVSPQLRQNQVPHPAAAPSLVPRQRLASATHDLHDSVVQTRGCLHTVCFLPLTRQQA